MSLRSCVALLLPHLEIALAPGLAEKHPVYLFSVAQFPDTKLSMTPLLFEYWRSWPWSGTLALRPWHYGTSDHSGLWYLSLPTVSRQHWWLWWQAAVAYQNFVLLLFAMDKRHSMAVSEDVGWHLHPSWNPWLAKSLCSGFLLHHSKLPIHPRTKILPYLPDAGPKHWSFKGNGQEVIFHPFFGVCLSVVRKPWPQWEAYWKGP